MVNNTCRICTAILTATRAKVCSNPQCKSKWKILRNKALPTQKKTCDSCATEFETQDRRNNFCSPKCKYSSASKVMVEKYGYSNPAQKPRSEDDKKRVSENISKGLKKAWSENKHELLTTRNSNNEKKFGVRCTFNLPGVSEKRKESNRLKYGVRSPRLIPIILSNGFSTYSEFCKEVINTLEKSKLNPYSSQFKDLIKEKFGVSHEVVDDVLQHENRYDILNRFKSSAELELNAFVTNLGIENVKTNTRPLFMYGLELDLYLPDQKIAIEFHGLAHHSERPIFGPKEVAKVKSLHKEKYDLCSKAGIRLIQIFEDEWTNKRPVIKSMLRSRLGKIQNKIFARKTEIRPLDPTTRRKFFEANHIAGDTLAPYAAGLYHEGELVTALSLRKPWTKAYGEHTVEIARFASKLDSNVIGGFSKLVPQMEEYCRANGFDSILTYADLRFGTGSVYQDAGFELVGTTDPNYFYEKGGIRESRFSHRKSNDPEIIAMFGSTERQQNNNQGWFAIYDAGSNVFLRRLNQKP